MGQAEATLYAASLAALVALTGAVIAAVVTLRSESAKRREAKNAEDLKQLREWTARVFVHLFAIQHEIEWLCWHARFRPDSITKERIADYDKAIHSAYLELLGSMAVIAGVDHSLFKKLKGVADDLYNFEGKIGRDSVGVPDIDAVTRIAGYFGSAHQYYEELPEKLADAMASASVQPASTKR